MSVVPIESVDSSVIFGGLNQSVSMYNEYVVIGNSGPSVLDAEEVRYEQIAEVYLHTGVFYATLILSTRSGYRMMVRWLPRNKAIRVADLIRDRMRSA